MLRRWDTRNYDIELILAVFDSVDIDFDSMDIRIDQTVPGEEISSLHGGDRQCNFKRAS